MFKNHIFSITDTANSVLSLLYIVLFNRMVAAVRAVSLDPAVGYLHTPDYEEFPERFSSTV